MAQPMISQSILRGLLSGEGGFGTRIQRFTPKKPTPGAAPPKPSAGMAARSPKGHTAKAPFSPKFGEVVPTLGPQPPLPYRPEPYQGAPGMGGFGIPAPTNTGFSGYGFPGGVPLPPLSSQQPLRMFADSAPSAGEMPGVQDPRKLPTY